VLPGTFPATCTAYGIPSIHEFGVISENPEFRQEWVRIRRAPGDSYNPRYLLEISPGDTGHAWYGAHPLRLSWGQPGRAATPKASACPSSAGPYVPGVR